MSSSIRSTADERGRDDRVIDVQFQVEGRTFLDEDGDAHRISLDTSPRCPLCSEERGFPMYLLGLYPSPSLNISIPGTEADISPVCAECGDRVMDIIFVWDRCEPDEFEDNCRLDEAYKRAVDECSFCGDGLGEAILGVSMLLEGDHDAGYTESAHTLCESCAHVFEQFLGQVAGGDER